MNKSEKEKAKHRCKEWIHQAAYKTYERSGYDHWFSSDSIGQFAAERPRDHCCEGKERDHEPLVIRTAE